MYDDGELVEQCRSGDRSALSSGDQVIDDIVNLRAVVEHEAQDELVGRKCSKGQAERVDLSSEATIDGVVSEQSSSDEPATYHLADLAAASAVSERTIRYYQGERLLPRPGKRGRDAVYSPAHLERLALIGELRDRGLTL